MFYFESVEELFIYKAAYQLVNVTKLKLRSLSE